MLIGYPTSGNACFRNSTPYHAGRMEANLGGQDIWTKAKDFHDQFLVSPQPIPVPPEGWQTRRCSGWHLASHPSLPVILLLSPDGNQAGFAIGHPIDDKGRFVRRDLHLPSVGGASPTPDNLERWIYGFGGRFVFVILLPTMQRLYLDPAGSLATVWCPRRQRIASTTSLLLLDEPDHPMFRIGPSEFPRNRHDLFYPAGLTAAAGVRRLITNHFLDLRTWKATRHYPKTACMDVAESEIPPLIDTFHQIVRRQIGALIDECGGAYLGLTGGQDSRRLLACARDFIDRLECVTVKPKTSVPGTGKDIDSHITRRLARHASLRHRFIQMGIADESSSADYLLRIGYAGGVGKAGKFWDPPRKHLDLSQAWMIGHCGEVGKAVYWQRLPLKTRPTVENLFRVMRMPQQPGFAEAIQIWLDGLPEGPPVFYLNMAHLELRVGGWACAHLYGAAPFRINLLPVSHRDVIDVLLRLPTEFKAAGGLTREVLKLAWPELLAIPFNQYSGLKSWEVRAREWVTRQKKRLLRT